MGSETWAPLKFSDEYSLYLEGGYDGMIDSFRYVTLATARLGDCQGDALFFLRDGESYGFLSVGYGSCSGCDSLDGCGSREQVESLRASIHSDIAWQPSVSEAWEWLCGRDWQGQYLIGKEQEEFVRHCLGLLPMPKFGSDSHQLLANDAPPEIVADSVQEDGYDLLANGLRNPHAGAAVLARLKSIIT